jgi:hypothetical protein
MVGPRLSAKCRLQRNDFFSGDQDNAVIQASEKIRYSKFFPGRTVGLSLVGIGWLGYSLLAFLALIMVGMTSNKVKGGDRSRPN